MSLRKLDKYHAHLQALQKEKSDRLHKVLEYINEVHHFKSLVARLPPRAHSVYYRDEIGNISTSHLRGDFRKIALSKIIPGMKMSIQIVMYTDATDGKGNGSLRVQ